MPKNPRQYRCCLILTTALAIVTSSADTLIENYTSASPQLLAKQEEGCKDSEGNLIVCPQHHSFHHSEYPQLETEQ